MFVSKRRDLSIPQSEHARFAGTIAAFWGNDDFLRPPLPRKSFTLGVMSHDRGYGVFDSLGIGQVDEAAWLAAQHRGILMRSPDPVVDTVVLMHLRRLVSGHDSDAAKGMTTLIDTRIDENLEYGRDERIVFQRADSVTDACDMISFRFCFEEPIRFVQGVASGSSFRDVKVVLGDEGLVELQPWPLSVPELHGCILAYSSEGYPEHLKPVVLSYHVVPGTPK